MPRFTPCRECLTSPTSPTSPTSLTCPTSPTRPLRANPLRAFWRTSALIVICATLFPLYSVHRLFTRGSDNRRRIALRWMKRWAKACSWALGYKIAVRGPAPPPGAFLAPNHISYSDVFVLLATAPCFFVPKDEIARWPFVGILVRGTEHIFSTRRRRARDLAATADAIEERLRAGFPVCAFLEGTTSSGESVLPFRPAFLEPAIRCAAPIVPAALRWRATRPGTSVSEHVAFWKNHVFLPHILRHLGLGGFEVEIVFGEPVPSAGRDRKALAMLLRDRVLEMRSSCSS